MSQLIEKVVKEQQMSQLIEKVVKENVQPKIEGVDIAKFEQSARGAFAFESSVGAEAAHLKMASKYQPINMEFLKMRDKDHWPQFAVFTLSNTRCFFSGTYFHRHRSRYKNDPSRELLFSSDNNKPISNIGAGNNRMAEDFISRYFLDVIYRLIMLGYKERGRTEKVFHQISQTFGAALPSKTREAINLAIGHDGFRREEIMVVCESAGWEVDKEVEMRPKITVDPLVIGWSQDSGRGYIIDVFDLTTMEDYVRREFSISQESESVE